MRGYALLTVLLVSSLVLSISLSITSLTLRQIQTHALVEQSMQALNAANAGYECAYYWDTVANGVLMDQTSGPFYPANAVAIDCFGAPITGSQSLNANGAISTFASNVGPNACVEVAVTKLDQYNYVDASGVTQQGYFTTITSDGYNSQMSGATCDKSDNAVLQRTIFIPKY